MAGNKNSGGMRPTAPQNNPVNISATGGNGQSGNGTQAARYIPSMKSLGSTGVETMAQQTAAPLAGDTSVPRNIDRLLTGTPVIPITDKTRYPGRSIMYGIDSETALPSNPLTALDSGLAAIKALYALDPRNEDLRRIIASYER